MVEISVVSTPNQSDSDSEDFDLVQRYNILSIESVSSNLVSERTEFYEDLISKATLHKTETSSKDSICGDTEIINVSTPDVHNQNSPTDEATLFSAKSDPKSSAKLSSEEAINSEFHFDSTNQTLPSLTYQSIEEYKEKISFYLFREAKEEILSGGGKALTSCDFELNWADEINVRHNTFSLTIPMSTSFRNRFVSKKMRHMSRSPFFRNQGMFLMVGDETPWYCSVVDANTVWDKVSGEEKSACFIHMTIKSYPWNTRTLPVNHSTENISILPASLPTGRALAALSLLKNSDHVDFLLGNKSESKTFETPDVSVIKSQKFNESQKLAIATALANPITVIQGPPGSGKTSTIQEMITRFLLQGVFPIMVVAATNLAVDNIAEKFLGTFRNGDIIRVVSRSKELEYNLNHPVGNICLHNKVYDRVSSDIQALIDRSRSNYTLSAREYGKLTYHQVENSNDIIMRSKVILATSVTAGAMQFSKLPAIPVVIMDEATQSSEILSLVPLTLPGVEHFVMLGDQKQLNMVSKIPELSLSLFEREIMNRSFGESILLDTQYRMHPAISEFPRKQFYDNLLKDGITSKDRQHVAIPSNPIVFWDTGDSCPEEVIVLESSSEVHRTYRNKGEIAYIEKVLKHLIQDMGIARSKIGVVTPYKGQRDFISEHLVKNEIINPEAEHIAVEEEFYDLGEPTQIIQSISELMIASIDAFQGREKDFIVMSCVRSNDQNKIGFVGDERRMNVALTRAKFGLVLIGDVFCLRNGGESWKAYIEFLETRGSVSKREIFWLCLMKLLCLQILCV